MKLIKCFFIAYSLLLVALSASASDFHSVLQVKLKDNSTQLFVLSEKPKVTFDKTHIYINSSEFSATFSDVLWFAFVKEEKEDSIPPTSIDHLQEDVLPQMMLRYVDGHTVEVTGAETSASVSLFAVNGIQLTTDIKRFDNTVVIDLAAHPAGVYIIKVNSQSFKIRKR